MQNASTENGHICICIFGFSRLQGVLSRSLHFVEGRCFILLAVVSPLRLHPYVPHKINLARPINDQLMRTESTGGRSTGSGGTEPPSTRNQSP